MLSTTSEYALRALSQLAAQPEGSAILGRELAKTTRIPANYLSKILLSLRNAGLVATARGSGGGYRLLRPADSVHLIDVVELFDGPAARPGCFLGVNQQCSDDHPCTAHHSWGNVRKAYVGFLENTTLSDISHTPRPKTSR